MVGPVVVFIAVCVIVAIYMSIVHSFLRAAEKVDGDETSPVKTLATNNVEAREIHRAPREQWAH
jgi:hypothetical protein